MRLQALRGAITVEDNESGAILSATEELAAGRAGAKRSCRPSDLVSCIFTVTDDLDAEFPAVAARRIGLDGVPLLCAREIPVPGSLPGSSACWCTATRRTATSRATSTCARPPSCASDLEAAQ